MEADLLAARALYQRLNADLVREDRRRRARSGWVGDRLASGVTPRSVRAEGQLCSSIVLLHLL